MGSILVVVEKNRRCGARRIGVVPMTRVSEGMQR